MGWIVDNAGTLNVLLGVLALIFLGIGYQTSRAKFYGYALVCLGLIGLIWLLGSFTMTDRKQVVATIEQLAAAFEERRGDEVIRRLSKDFEHQGLSRADVEAKVRTTANWYKIKEIRVSQFEIPELSRERARAKVVFRVRVTGDSEQMFIGLIRGDMVLEQGVWVLHAFEVFNPLVNTDRPITGYVR